MITRIVGLVRQYLQSKRDPILCDPFPPGSKIQKINCFAFTNAHTFAEIIQLTIGGKSPVELEQELIAKNIDFSYTSQAMLRSKSFTVLPNPVNIRLIKLSVEDLGFQDYAKIQQIYDRAYELRLELCPAEVGVYLRLKYPSESINPHFIAMKPMEGCYTEYTPGANSPFGYCKPYHTIRRYRSVFFLQRNWLSSHPATSFNYDQMFIFYLP